MTITTTKTDPAKQLALIAVAHLEAARYAREQYDRVLHMAIDTYGDTQRTPISGIYADHFPTEVKNQLRAYCREINYQTAKAVEVWLLRARRRIHTLRPLLQYYRQMRDGRISYY